MEPSFVHLGSKFTCISRLPLHPAVNYEYFILYPCLLGVSQLGCYFLCRSFMGFSKLRDFWSNEFPLFVSLFVFLDLQQIVFVFSQPDSGL
jgi:hypothetical protein